MTDCSVDSLCLEALTASFERAPKLARLEMSVMPKICLSLSILSFHQLTADLPSFIDQYS